jgi:hypothetical protein
MESGSLIQSAAFSSGITLPCVDVNVANDYKLDDPIAATCRDGELAEDLVSGWI